MYDRLNPAPGVRVAPVLIPRAKGLSMAQHNAAYGPMTNDKGEPKTGVAVRGVLQPFVRLCGPVGLGMLSTAHATVHLERTLPTRPVNPGQPRTPGRKTYQGRSNVGPKNPIFQAKLPHKIKLRRDEMARACNHVKQLHSEVVRFAGTVRGRDLARKYASVRREFLASFPESTRHIESVEKLHKLHLARAK